MWARIKIESFLFRTVISRAVFFKSRKGVAFRDTLLTLRIIKWKQIRKIYRVNRRQRKLYGIQESLYRSRLTGYLWRDARVSWNATPRHFCNVFLPGGSYHPFPQSSFSSVRLQSAFARCRKQETRHGLQHPCSICRLKIQSFRISPRSWPRWRKNANVINCYHNVTS